jgi:hypothetical protein
MANATADLIRTTIGAGGPFVFDLPIDGGSTIYANTLVTQLTATGMVVPYSTAAAGVCVGMSEHGNDNAAGADGAKRVRIQTKFMVALANGAGGDAFSEASLIGAVVYGSDDHTVADNSNSQARKAIGFFYGMETDGLVRVFLDPQAAAIVNALQGLTDAPATADALRDEIVAAFG